MAKPICPKCGTPMMEFNIVMHHEGTSPNPTSKTADWHCPEHGKQMTVTTGIDWATEGAHTVRYDLAAERLNRYGS